MAKKKTLSDYYTVEKPSARVNETTGEHFFDTVLVDLEGNEYTTYISEWNDNFNNWIDVLRNYDEVIVTNIKKKKGGKNNTIINADSIPEVLYRNDVQNGIRELKNKHGKRDSFYDIFGEEKKWG